MTTTIVFSVSLFAICAMIGGKMFQRNVKRIDFITSISRRLNNIIGSVVNKFITKYNLYRKITQLFFFEFLPSFTYELLAKAKDYVAKKYYVMGDQFRGRRVLRSSGSVSFFLERLAEDRGEVRAQNKAGF
jgi:hypothetical protein